jgi:hypothetical protein
MTRASCFRLQLQQQQRARAPSPLLRQSVAWCGFSLVSRVRFQDVGWTFFFMFVVLKIPVIALLCLVWWAVREEPSRADEEPREPERRGPDDPRTPRRPRPPRRGPHAEPPPASPQRVRARGKRIQRTHG